MDFATDSISAVTDRPRLLPMLLRLVPDPCREWIDSPNDTTFEWGEFRYCRQRREDGLTVFIELRCQRVPECFTTEKIEWKPWLAPQEPDLNLGRQFELWSAAALQNGETLPSIVDHHIPACGIRSWRGDSGGGGSLPYHILAERQRVLVHLKEWDARDGLRSLRCGISHGMVALLFPQMDPSFSPARKLGFRIVMQDLDTADQISRRGRGMVPEQAAKLAADTQALLRHLKDPEIAALEWPKKQG